MLTMDDPWLQRDNTSIYVGDELRMVTKNGYPRQFSILDNYVEAGIIKPLTNAEKNKH